MRVTRNLALSCEILAAHKTRTLLSVGGIVVGVGAVILMVAVGRGAEQRILSCIRSMGTNLIIINAGQTQIIAGRERQATTVKTLLPSDAQAIAKDCPSVALTASVVRKKMPVRWGTGAVHTTVMGMSADGFRIRNLPLTSGRPFEPQEARAARRVALVCPTVAKTLFGDTNPVGQLLRIGRVPFEVIGVAAPKGTDINGVDQDDLVIVPLETAMRRLFNVTYLQAIHVQGRSAEGLDQAEKEITALLRQRHRLQGKGDDFTIQNQATILEAERETSHTLTLLIGSVAGISLAVGGFGILAVMLMSVRERTREIGLRRAVGARRRDIRTQFLLEAVLLSGAGGLIGVGAGIAATFALSGLRQWEPTISWPAVAVGFVFSVSLGIAFGIYPAARASRLEPIEALRAE